MSMQIFVKTVRGYTLAVDVEADETINEIKRKIHDKEGIAPEHQRLVFAGQDLQNERTLAEYNIQKESIHHLHLRIQGGSGMQIFFKRPDGTSFAVDVESSDTIENVKRKVETQERLAEADQRYVFSGKRLDDERVLSDYNIKHESTIHLIMRLRYTESIKPEIPVGSWERVELKTI